MQANCPICLEDIGTGNRVLTECGHEFHASCLMKNVAHNGFGCPYCRTAMADEVAEEEEEYGEEEEEYVLRGLRFFDNNISGSLHDVEDITDELYLSQETINVKPTSEYIAEKIIEQGVTIEDFVKAVLSSVAEYADAEEEYVRVDDDLYTKIRSVIINYQVENI